MIFFLQLGWLLECPLTEVRLGLILRPQPQITISLLFQEVAASLPQGTAENCASNRLWML